MSNSCNTQGTELFPSTKVLNGIVVQALKVKNMVYREQIDTFI